MNKILIDLPEIIETKNLTLEMPRAGFGAAMHKAILDGYDDFYRWLNWPSHPPSIEEVEISCRKHHSQFISREYIHYMIVEKTSNKPVGRCAFPDFQACWEIPQFGISYFIAKTSRGKGYATEAAQAMVELAFSTLEAKKVEIYADYENKASQMVPKKLGFTLEYTTKGRWPRYDGTLGQLQCYALFSKEFFKKG